MKNKKWSSGAKLPRQSSKVYKKLELEAAEMLKAKELKLEDTDGYNFEFEEVD